MKYENWGKEDFGNGKFNIVYEIEIINLNYRKKNKLNILNRM